MTKLITLLILVGCALVECLALGVVMAPSGIYSDEADKLSVLMLVVAPSMFVIVALEYRSVTRRPPEKEDQS